MEVPENVKQHVTEERSNEVAKICQPLFDAFNLNFFCYIRVYENKETITLSSNHQPVYYAFQSQTSASVTVVPEGFHLWREYRSEEFLQDEISLFGHYSGITIHKALKNYRENILLAAPKENHQAISECFNNQDILGKFVLYFKDKSSVLIKDLAKSKFILPDYMIGSQQEELPNYEEFLNLIKTNKIRFDFLDKEIVFSQREYECLQQLSMGRSMKAAGNELGIASKTVEQHVARAKEKTNLHSKSQLVDLIHNNVISI